MKIGRVKDLPERSDGANFTFALSGFSRLNLTFCAMKVQIFSIRGAGLLVFALLSGWPLLLSQTLRGSVRDADNGQALPGARVALTAQQKNGSAADVVTDAAGQFFFENIRPGYYRCTVRAEGFENQTLAELNVAAGKQQNLEIALRRSGVALPELTVTAAPTSGYRPVQPLGEISLTRDQTLRFPAMYFDPGRLAAAHAGVAQTDDGINGMSIRGNGPNSVRWRLEGADVVNPNHLPNAGTFSDRPAAASGGVLMFSAQLLDNSSLLTGAFPAGYGDALGGVMDMRLRSGNRRQHEFTAQAGLIGLDLAAEGPLSTADGGRRTASYLVNYRYSTVGLLGQMGVSFGDEQINFQDLSFMLSFPGEKGGEWRVFGLGGLSENIFEHKSDSLKIKQFKDFFDIDFKSQTGIVGVSNWSPLGRRTWLKTALVASGQSSERGSTHISEQRFSSSDEVMEGKICGTATLSHRLGAQWRLLAGAMLTQQNFRVKTAENNSPQTTIQHEFLTTQPWAELHWRSRSERTSVQAGLHTVFFPYPENRQQSSPEPRLTLTQVLSVRHRLSLSAGRYSQIAPLWLSDEDLGLQRAWQTSLRHTWLLPNEWSLRSEMYWQRSNQAGVDAGGRSAFSLINQSDYTVFLQKTLSYKGLSENRGLEVTAERYLSGGWFALANATFFDSRYQGSDGLWRSTRWDLGHLANLTLGREWLREKSAEQTRSFGLNGRAVLAGGFRAMPIDEAASALASATVFDEREGFSLRQPGYFRLDFRVYWRRGFAGRRNSTFAMDFQNVTMQKNTAYRYYDPFTQQVETKYQLGLIPNMSWRVEF